MSPLDAIRAVFASDLKGAQRMVAVVAASHLGKSGTYFLGEASMAREAGLSDRGARKATAALVSAGILVDVSRRPSGTLVRRLDFNALPVTQQGEEHSSPRNTVPPEHSSPPPGTTFPPGGNHVPGNPEPRSPEEDQKRTIEEDHEEALLPEVVAHDPPAPLFSDAIRTPLQSAGLSTLADIAKRTRSQLLSLPGIGKVAVTKIEAVLAAHDLALKPPPPTAGQRGQPYAVAWCDVWKEVLGFSYPGDVASGAHRLGSKIKTLRNVDRARLAFRAYLVAENGPKKVWPLHEEPSLPKFLKGLDRWMTASHGASVALASPPSAEPEGFEDWVRSTVGDSRHLFDEEELEGLYQQHLSELQPTRATA